MHKIDIAICAFAIVIIFVSFGLFDSYVDSLKPTEKIVVHTTTTKTTETTTTETTTTTSPAKVSLGECRISAYCGCPDCCGAWSTDGIIRGAAGCELCEGVSCACNGFDFGTELEVDGVGTFIVQDRLAEWVDCELGKTVDIYFDDHASALEFGLKWANVDIIS